MRRDATLINLQPSPRDLIMFHDVPRTSVLGVESVHFQSQGLRVVDREGHIL